MSDVDDELDPVAQTGRVTAAMRARESDRPDRLFEDPFAARLAGARGRELVAAFDGGDQVIAVRTRLIDDEFARRTDEFDQFVILAAGMDTRAYRLAFRAGTAVFEVDRPAVLDLKERLLTAPPEPAAEPRCDRRPVGADLGADWATPLRAAGFRPDRPTCWLAEGLTQYLEEADVHRLLDAITALSAPGSDLVVDFVGQSVLDSPAMRPMLAGMAERGMAWRYGTDDPGELLTGRGWTAEVLRYGEAAARLGRPLDPGAGEGFLVRARRVPDHSVG